MQHLFVIGKETSNFSKGRGYIRNLKSNKSSIAKIMDNIKPSIESNGTAKCLFLCCYVRSSDTDRR